MRILLIGAPGAGKGTQAKRIAEHFGLTAIATGELLRAEMAAGTVVGREAKRYVDHGDLVPDELVIALTVAKVVEAIDNGGYVLDGYPRTLAQAEAAYRWATARRVTFDLAIYFDIGKDELIARLLKRSKLEGRSDDTEATIRHRLEVFERDTLPLVEFYKERGVLLTIDAVGHVDAVTERIFAELHWQRARMLEAGALGGADKQSPGTWTSVPGDSGPW
jgi:adenylate kinase